MANTIMRPNHQNKALASALVLFSLLCLIKQGSAYEFKVGGAKGWAVPSDSNAAYSYNQWAQKNRFQIGDTLLFVYHADQDSVLHVKREDYDSCNTGSPLEKFTDGHTSFPLKHSGPHYFISGVQDNCKKNEKMEVIVMADRSGRSPTSNATTPPSPSPSETTVPSPAPSGEAPPSPPGESTEKNPSPAPSEETPTPPHSASSIYMGFVGMIGTFVSSFMLLAF